MKRKHDSHNTINERKFVQAYPPPPPPQPYYQQIPPVIYPSSKPRNETAFIVGLIFGLFGIWGVAHIANHKLGMGCLWMFFIGPALVAALSIGVFMTAGIGLVLAVPLWIGFVYTQAKNGSSNY